MNSAETAVDLLRMAREAVLQVREALRTPNPHSLEQCSGPLTSAADCIRKLGACAGRRAGERAAQGEASPDDLRALARQLHRDLTDVRSMLQQAEGFHMRCVRILLSAAGAYTATGGIDPAGGRRSLSVEG